MSKQVQTRFVYIGQRFYKGALYYVFVPLSAFNAGYQAEDEAAFRRTRKNYWWFKVGHTYEITHNDDGTGYLLGQEKVVDQGPACNDEKIRELSAASKMAQDEKNNLAALEKASKENGDAWLECLLPIRNAMQFASVRQRAAMKLAVMQEMEKW